MNKWLWLSILIVTDDNSDLEELVQKTGTFIKSSATLSKTFLQIKSCTDLNKESPHKVCRINELQNLL